MKSSVKSRMGASDYRVKMGSKLMLRSLPLENTVNTSSQLEKAFVTTSKWYLPVVNWEISKHHHLFHLASLTLIAVYLAKNMLKI